MKIKDLSKEQLKELRKEIVLNSLFTKDYENSLGVDAHECQEFFDGYVEYLEELENSDYGMGTDISTIIDLYDNDDNLINWFNCIEW